MKSASHGKQTFVRGSCRSQILQPWKATSSKQSNHSFNWSKHNLQVLIGDGVSKEHKLHEIGEKTLTLHTQNVWQLVGSVVDTSPQSTDLTHCLMPPDTWSLMCLARDLSKRQSHSVKVLVCFFQHLACPGFVWRGYPWGTRCLEAWKAACVNSWIHRHGAACGKEFVSELSCRNHACRTTAEQRQLSLLASCRFQDKPIGNVTAQSLFFLEESCRVKRSDTQTFSNFSNYFKRVLKLQKRSSSFSK